MMKNGRPYTNENDFVDNMLMTGHSQKEVNMVLNWIKMNIKHSKFKDPYHSSYGMKHILEKDTGLYLTNNEFKDAMMMAGFKPVDENQLNWYYRISEDSPAFHKGREKPLREADSYFTWMMKKYLDHDSPEGDLANDMKHDEFDFTTSDSHDAIADYLHTNGACGACLDAFESSYREYMADKVVRA